jgi:hypothetical protein
MYQAAHVSSAEKHEQHCECEQAAAEQACTQQLPLATRCCKAQRSEMIASDSSGELGISEHMVAL